MIGYIIFTLLAALTIWLAFALLLFIFIYILVWSLKKMKLDVDVDNILYFLIGLALGLIIG